MVVDAVEPRAIRCCSGKGMRDEGTVNQAEPGYAEISQWGIAMGFLPEWLARMVGDTKFDQTVERIVRLLEPGALKAVAVHSPGMSSFEARGYIRARSALMVSQQVAAEIHAGVGARHRRRLTEAVREQLTQILLPQLDATPATVAIPFRRAA